MNKKVLLFLTSIIPVLTLGLTSCDTDVGGGDLVLRILNWEDYIYEQSIEDGYEAPDMIDQFKSYLEENYPIYKNATIVYDSTDTNETMYNELQTGKSHYDLICPSDYMIQKLIKEDLVTKIDRSLVPNYDKYVSNFMRNRLDSITTDRRVSETEVVEESLKDYAIGYMWGTLGLVFNPTYSEFTSRGYSEEEVIYDLSKYESLWDEKYKNTISVKDSMRDTYTIGVLEIDDNKQKLIDARDAYLIDNDADVYNEIVSGVLNDVRPDTVNEVSKKLGELKKNVFGLEVDSGKQDIVTGKIGINFAWSGDACYSIYQASDETQVDEPFDLLYSVPEYGSNIWFDGWVMPKDDTRSEEQYELAHIFMNFMCDPTYATQNTDYIGYTSFVGGDLTVDLVRDYYDIRTEYVYYGEDYESLYYEDPNTLEEVEVSFSSFYKEEDKDVAYDNVELYYYSDENKVPINETFNERLLLLEEWESVNLAYIFENTLEEYSFEDNDHIFYSDGYLPFTNPDGSQNICVGGQFFCAYPDIETMNRCAVMEDFGDSNDLILQMWENFKSDPLPLWAIILFGSELAIGIFVISYFFLAKNIKLKLRKKRKESI